MGIGLFVVLGAIVVLVVIFAVRGTVTVRQSEARVIERLGKYHRTLSSGVHIIWPLIDKTKKMKWRIVKEMAFGQASEKERVAKKKLFDRADDAEETEFVRGETFDQRDEIERTKIVIKDVETDVIDLREILYDFPKQNAITKDNANLSIDALLYYQITDPARAVYEIDNLPNAIEKLTQTTLRSVVGGLDLDETLSSRDTINTKLRAVLDEATDKWGVKINRVELQEISPPKKIRDAMDSQMEAERARRAEVIKAEGQKRAKILVAEGEAEARVRVAGAEAEAIAFITKAFAEEEMDPANYLIAMKYIETLKEMVSGKDNKVVYLPYEATAILGSIGGIQEMFKTTNSIGR